MFPKPKTFEEACAMRGYDPNTALPDVSKMPEHLREYTLAQAKRVIIAEAIKEGKHPQPGEWRYAPYFRTASAGGFVFMNSYYTLTLTDLGARLEFEETEQSDYFGQNFTELHKAALLAEPGQ